MNRHIRARLDAARRLLMAIHAGGLGLSSATQGREREAFVRLFLAEMLPTVHRFGLGDITDALGEKTGQIDVVIEYPFLPSLQSPGLERLYLAESVAAALEVKSDLKKKWDEVCETARDVKRLTRRSGLTGMYGGRPPPRVPLFAVGYTGWKNLDTLTEKVQDGLVDGILVIDAGLFASTRQPINRRGDDPENAGGRTDFYTTAAGENENALWAFLCCLTEALHGMTPIGQVFPEYAANEALEPGDLHGQRGTRAVPGLKQDDDIQPTTMLLTREQARALDRRAMEEFAVPGLVLMENAGRGMAELLRTLGVAGQVVLCCGKGNNGGDGFVIARHLDNAGVCVRVLLFADPAELRGDAAVNYTILVKSGVPIEIRTAVEEASLRADLEADWMVDALFGSGLQGPVRSPFDVVIAAINASPARVFAVDIPSGLDSDAGRPMGPTVRAHHTATVAALKRGFLEPTAREWLGQVHIIDMGAPRRLFEEAGR